MNRKLWLCATVGALVGAAAVQTAHVVSDRNSRELFGQRLRCKALADKYVKGRSHMVVISRVEFSRSRGSCIASAFEQVGLDPAAAEQLGLKAPADYTYEFNVVDLLTGEELASRGCTTTKFLDWGDPECTKSLQKRDEAFEKAR
jgi:hypothetical protein